MATPRIILQIAVSAALAFASAPIHAQGDGMGLSESQTRRVAEMMDTGFTACAKAEVLYRPDCYQQVYRSAAKALGSNAGYWEAEVAMTRVGRNLYTFVRANTDSKAGRIRAGNYRVKAIKKESLPLAGAVYQDSVAKAEAILRSGSSAEQKFFKPFADLIAEHKTAVPR